VSRRKRFCSIIAATIKKVFPTCDCERDLGAAAGDDACDAR
jgi:hypothetical protein